MSNLLNPEGSLALAIAALQLVLGYRFTLAERGRDLLGLLVYALAVGQTFAAERGFLPGVVPSPVPLQVRLAGAAVLCAGLWLAGASSKARLLAGRGALATGGAYSRIRHPLYLGLGLALIGGLLRSPTVIGGALAGAAAGVYAALGALDERGAARAFGTEWRLYAARTRAILPLRRSPGRPG